jgi:hypothetical protein
MQRYPSEPATLKSDRHHGRKEWDRSGGEGHPMEARDRVRQPAKCIRTHGIREAEAERQIRELRARY